jgi:hypothetical protein
MVPAALASPTGADVSGHRVLHAPIYLPTYPLTPLSSHASSYDNRSSGAENLSDVTCGGRKIKLQQTGVLQFMNLIVYEFLLCSLHTVAKIILSIYLSIYVYLSLSLYIYIYIYIYSCVRLFICPSALYLTGKITNYVTNHVYSWLRKEATKRQNN